MSFITSRNRVTLTTDPCETPLKRSFRRTLWTHFCIKFLRQLTNYKFKSCRCTEYGVTFFVVVKAAFMAACRWTCIIISEYCCRISFRTHKYNQRPLEMIVYSFRFTVLLNKKKNSLTSTAIVFSVSINKASLIMLFVGY